MDRQLGPLSQRESEVARLIAHGLTTPQIATHLRVATRTAETYVERIFKRLELHSRAQVAAWAAQSGLLGPADAARPPPSNPPESFPS
jgi:DNA-binding NarL/FixJ family response regulator